MLRFLYLLSLTALLTVAPAFQTHVFAQTIAPPCYSVIQPQINITDAEVYDFTGSDAVALLNVLDSPTVITTTTDTIRVVLITDYYQFYVYDVSEDCTTTPLIESDTYLQLIPVFINALVQPPFGKEYYHSNE